MNIYQLRGQLGGGLARVPGIDSNRALEVRHCVYGVISGFRVIGVTMSSLCIAWGGGNKIMDGGTRTRVVNSGIANISIPLGGQPLADIFPPC